MKRGCLLFSVLAIVSSVGLYLFLKPYYIPAVKLYGLTVKTHYDDTIRIAYVGDSWAEGHQSAKCVIDSIICNVIKKPVIVRTAGVGGLTSKDIYNGLFENSSMRNVIEWGPDFCFVVAGINDTDRKKGRNYYKENMKLIIETLLDNKITPIILEIPSYDILYSFNRKRNKFKLRYCALMFLTWSKLDCINDYRKAYVDLILEKRWERDVITISCDEWNFEGYQDQRGLYHEDHMHLNEKGYLVLDSCISNHIINYLNVFSGTISF